jgi:hypothetical protein
LKTLHVIFINFPKLHISEAATLCIPHLVGALKSGNEAAQDSVLDTFFLLKQSWSTMPIDIAKSQAIIAAEAIPILQMLMKSCPPSFHERADTLLHCLPGCLTVTIKRGNNLKQSMGSTNAFCQLTIGNGPPKQTKVLTPMNNCKFCRSTRDISLYLVFSCLMTCDRIHLRTVHLSGHNSFSPIIYFLLELSQADWLLGLVS